MWQFRDLNIAAMAESLGCRGIRVEHPEAVAPALAEALQADRPVVLDVVTDMEALAPDPWG